MSAKKIIITLLLTMVVLAGGFWLKTVWHDKFERVTEEIEMGFRGEAHSNSLYASRLFLHAMGITAQRIAFYDLDQLPPTDAVVVINTYRTTLSETRINNLLNWVEQGGHLLTIVVPDYIETDDYVDRLQHKLDITTQHAYYFNNNEHYKKRANENNIDNIPETEDTHDNKNDDDDDVSTVSIALAGIDKKYTVAITHFDPIESKAAQEERVQIKGKTFLLNRPYGDGLVSLISDLQFAENEQIEDYDHAELFWQLVHRHQHSPSNVWLLNTDDMPPLWQWLWQHASAFIITLSLLAILWLYGVSQRFGPLIPAQTLDRRRIVEHIQASGHFFWRHDQQQLIHSSRQSVQQKFETLFPAWHQLEQTEQIKQASEYSQLSTKEVQSLLYDDKPLSIDAFIDLVQRLEQLRKS